MSSTVINVFDKSGAESVVRELEKDGFARSDINVVTDGADATNLMSTLTNASVPEEQARQYVRQLGDGKTLVHLRADDDKAGRAAAIMERYSAARSTATGGGERVSSDGEVSLPVIEERLVVGKREVQSGGVRVQSHVTERPIEESVTLRDETIHVDRHPVDRGVTQADMTAVREGAFEMTETDEEAVVSKHARVVEEVVVGKETTEHQEIVKDTVRRMDVEIEQIDTDTTEARGKSNRS